MYQLDKNKYVLITGAAGFIGSNLAKRLVGEGYKVVGIDNLNLYYSPRRKLFNIKDLLTKDNFHFEVVDIENSCQLEEIFKNFPVGFVVHLAARAGVRPSLWRTDWYKETNISGTINLLELASKYQIANFILGSSSSVYGERDQVPFREDDCINKPASPYAASKAAAELFAFTYSYLRGIPVTILRFFTVYGPANRPDMMMYIFTKGILNGEEIIRYGDGSSKRSYTYIDDIVDGIIRALQMPVSFRILNLGGERTFSLSEVISTLEKVCGRKAKIKERPRIAGDVMITWADNSRARQELNWRPQVSLEEGCRRLVEWYKSRQNLKEKIYLPGITKRILVFSLTCPPLTGEEDNILRQVTKRIDHYFFDIISWRFDRSWPVFEQQDQVRVYRVGGGRKWAKFLFPWWAFFKAWQLQSQQPYDLIWGIESKGGGLAGGLFKFFYRQIKYILSLLGEKKRLLWVRKRKSLFFPFLWKQADIIQVTSLETAEAIKSKGCYNKVRVIVDKERSWFLEGQEQKEIPEKIGRYKEELAGMSTEWPVSDEGWETMAEGMKRIFEEN